jgi:Flp pilus assembly protein TadG
MTSLLTRIRCDSGQAFIFVAFSLTVLIGMAALVIDGGSWYHAQRHLQTSADAAALAGAQDLPDQPSALAAATDYAQRNYSGLAPPAVTFPSDGVIDVRATTTAPGVFAKVVSAAFNSVTVKAHAQAQVSVPLFMKEVAPVAVKNTAACAVTDPTCYGKTITLSFDESQVASSQIGLINLDCHSATTNVCGSGGLGGSTLGDWIENGYSSGLPANQWYGIKTGETVGPVKHGFDSRAGTGQPLFFPVWDQYSSLGPAYHIVGWAAFVIDAAGVNWGSHTRELTGHFVTFTATDLASGGTIGGATDFGVHVITLTQ